MNGAGCEVHGERRIREVIDESECSLGVHEEPVAQGMDGFDRFLMGFRSGSDSAEIVEYCGHRDGGETLLEGLEALAFERAVVSTTIGAEGLDLVPGEDLLIADRPDGFARACADLLIETKRRDALARQGRETVKRLYSDEVAARVMLAALQQLYR